MFEPRTVERADIVERPGRGAQPLAEPSGPTRHSTPSRSIAASVWSSGVPASLRSKLASSAATRSSNDTSWYSRDRLDRQLVGDEFVDERQRVVGRIRLVAVVGPHLVAVRAADAVAVVTVGDQHVVGADLGRDRLHAVRVGDPFDHVLDPVDRDRAIGSPGSASSAVSPQASDRPHTGDRLACVARVRSSRSVDAFGVTRSCGSTPPAPSSTTSSPPSTPAMSRAVPAASVNRMR